MPFARRDGVRLHYEDVGTGPTVLLHTGGGGDGRMWERAGYVAALEGYRCLLLDHRGHGRSDAPATPQAHALAEYGADVVAVLDAAGVEHAALLGYSGGARVAYFVAARHPDLVAAVVGVGAVGGPDDDPAEYLEYASEVRQAGMRMVIEEMAAQEPEPAPAWLVDQLASTETEMFALLLEGLATAPTAWSDFPRITAPTLLVCGDQEDENAAAHARDAAAAMQDGRCEVLAGIAHLQAFWRTDLTLPVVASFLRDRFPAVAG